MAEEDKSKQAETSKEPIENKQAPRTGGRPRGRNQRDDRRKRNEFNIEEWTPKTKLFLF